MYNQYCKASELAKHTGMSTSTLKGNRLSGKWILGVHWVRITPKSVLYNLPLIMDWIANRSNPTAHQRAIDAYLASLPSAVTTETKKTTKRGKVA